jgi:signal transduction histidine kinase
VKGRWRAAAAAATVFTCGLIGSVAVALAVAIPVRDVALLLGFTSLGAIVVVLVGLAVQSGLRRHRVGVARHVALTAVVTAGASLAAIQAASSAMLVSAHDVTVVLTCLPVAIGAGVAYGIASSRGMVTDLEALAHRAAALEAGASPPPAGPAPRGAAEVATVAEALDAATVRLAAARDRERAMEAERRDLVAWISHDLRTPLASLRALAEALADGVATDETTRERYLAGLVAHVDRLTALVDALLELSQVEAGAFTLELEPVSLPELIAEVLQCFEPEARAAGVRLEASTGTGGTVLLAGRDQLNRVLANLVHNGIRHTRPGGRLLITVEEPGGDGSVVVRVRDSCGGIAAADLPRVFDRLWRGDPARSSRGAGLGLAIARGFVEAHGGTITVANVPGGCEFTVKLPRSPRQDPPQPSTTRRAARITFSATPTAAHNLSGPRPPRPGRG